jgi:hypothetical protein
MAYPDEKPRESQGGVDGGEDAGVRQEVQTCMLASYDKGVFVACWAGSLGRVDVNLVSKLIL